jgi:hypothetical protein
MLKHIEAHHSTTIHRITFRLLRLRSLSCDLVQQTSHRVQQEVDWGKTAEVYASDHQCLVTWVQLVY